MLNLLEGNAVQVPVKGSHRTWRPSVVYFTCNCHPRNWLWQRGRQERTRLSEEEWAQFRRRITDIVRFNPDGTRSTEVWEDGGAYNTEPPPAVGPPINEEPIPLATTEELPLFADWRLHNNWQEEIQNNHIELNETPNITTPSSTDTFEDLEEELKRILNSTP